MKKIAVIPNHTKDSGLVTTKKLVCFLNKKAEVYMNKYYENSGIDAIFGGEEIFEKVDACIVLGGDGTILRAAEPCARLHIPVMGINLGRIGFMTEIEVEEMEKAVDKLLTGDYRVEERMMMQIKVCKNDGKCSVYYAMNDAVISKPDSRMVAVELYREEEKINAYMADGIIIASPTGSTGYSLSAGGPVADPAMELFIATPICAHLLSSRAAILPANKLVRVKISEAGNQKAIVTVDGQIKENIACGEHIEIEKAKDKVMLIKMGTQSFYDILTDKLS